MGSRTQTCAASGKYHPASCFPVWVFGAEEKTIRILVIFACYREYNWVRRFCGSRVPWEEEVFGQS